MSTAIAQYQCEVCGLPLRFHGGRYKPRWCHLHREEATREARNQRFKRRRKHNGKPYFCQACEVQLMWRSESGFCTFCEVESGMREPI